MNLGKLSNRKLRSLAREAASIDSLRLIIVELSKRLTSAERQLRESRRQNYITSSDYLD